MCMCEVNVEPYKVKWMYLLVYLPISVKDNIGYVTSFLEGLREWEAELMLPAIIVRVCISIALYLHHCLMD